MTSIKTGLLRQITGLLTLLFAARLSAQMPPPKDVGPPEKVGKAQATSGFVIDRSPMMTATADAPKAYESLVQNANFNILGLSGPITASNASTVINSLILLTGSKNYPPREPPLPLHFPRRALQEQFRRYFWEQVAPSQQGSAALIPLVTTQTRTLLSSPNQPANRPNQQNPSRHPGHRGATQATRTDQPCRCSFEGTRLHSSPRNSCNERRATNRKVFCWSNNRAGWGIEPTTTRRLFFTTMRPIASRRRLKRLPETSQGTASGLKYDLIGFAPTPLAPTTTLFERREPEKRVSIPNSDRVRSEKKNSKRSPPSRFGHKMFGWHSMFCPLMPSLRAIFDTCTLSEISTVSRSMSPRFTRFGCITTRPRSSSASVRATTGSREAPDSPTRIRKG